YSSSAPSDFHPFPTRRSSDLALAVRDRVENLPLGHLAEAVVVIRGRGAHAVLLRDAVAVAERAVAGLAIDRETLATVREEFGVRSEEHTSELQSRENLVCRLL